MNLAFRGFRPEEGSPTMEALSAIRYASADSQSPQNLVAYSPVAKMNPFQSLIYQKFPKRGIATSPIFDMNKFSDLLAVKEHVENLVIHLHWLNSVIVGSTSQREAEQRVNKFLGQIEDFRGRGGKLAWTVHNLAPHDAVYLDSEYRLQQGIADQCDLVHVMSEDTPNLVSGILNLPENKTAVVPHPSYIGAYPDHVSRTEARLSLGIAPDEVVYIAFGAIKAYKGLEQLLEGFDRVRKTSSIPRRLIVAGKPDTSASTRKLVKTLRTHPGVLLMDRPVPVNDVQYLMNAADVMVLAHRVALNSGAALLGPTFGIPLLANRVGVLPHTLDDSFTEFFDATNIEDIVSSMLRADRLTTSQARLEAGNFADQHHTARISTDLAGAFERIIFSAS